MNSRRADILRELGLLPVWRLRAPAEAASPEPLLGEPDPAAAPAMPVQPELQGGDPRRDAILAMDWPQLKAAVQACTACGLVAGRTQTVFGVGDEQANWLFVGEGPGQEEDLKGEPFVGQAGRLLDSMLGAIGLRRGDGVYIANVVKCRPPGNRNPQPDEAAACEPFLTRQIQLIRPSLIVALGKVAVTALLGQDRSIASLRGRLLEYRGTPLVVTYHPAYLLRSLPDKARAWEDLCFARRTMRELGGGRK